jgi:hypothetical protein
MSFRLRHPPHPKLVEDDVERACLDYLRARGYRPFRQQSALLKTPDGRWIRVGEIGVPDYLIMHTLYPAFLLETKRPKGKLSDDQMKKLYELTEIYKLQAVVADDVDTLRIWVPQHEERAFRAYDEWLKAHQRRETGRTEVRPAGILLPPAKPATGNPE